MTKLKPETKLILVVGNDKISRQALSEINAHDKGVVVAVDRSTSIKRVLRLVLRGRLPFSLLARMYLAEAMRESFAEMTAAESIKTNTQLVELIETHRPSHVLLFRAGLIINRAVLSAGVPIMNIHCARLPEFGGIGTIDRALRAGAFDQCATLHQVTETIDSGRVYCTEPYRLSPQASYFDNEEQAYAAGRRLLQRILVDSRLLECPSE